MKLVAIDHPREGQTIQCSRCYQMRPVKEVMADMDGPAFSAYYCRSCVHWEGTSSEASAVGGYGGDKTCPSK